MEEIKSDWEPPQGHQYIPYHKLPKHVVYAFPADVDPCFFNRRVLGLPGYIIGFLKIRNIDEIKTYFSHVIATISGDAVLPVIAEIRKIQPFHHWHISWLILYTRMEKELRKEEILDLYLNRMYIGRGCWGVQSASLDYFGKSTEELSLAEAALLAGQLRGRKYDPCKDYFEAKEQQKRVINKMVEAGFITTDEGKAALEEVVAFTCPDNPRVGYPTR